ncbi:hypothetical protein [Brachybacterium vulturis]|uniref:hypothetical protein n=1 Tax=Brachybacterium vulturis TaxID=2017484 RepID=UPI003736F9AD
MYGWLFRALPGPLGARILVTVLLVAVIIVVLFARVFPAIAPLLPVDDGMVGAALSRSSSVA